MSKDITNSGQFKTGQSGNPKGRPKRSRILTELLQQQGSARFMVGHDSVTAQEALARAVWQFVVTGEVWLMGKKLEASSAGEWASVVKWLYAHVEPTQMATVEESDGEMVIRVVREE